MRELIVKPELYSFDTFDDFVQEFHINESDLIITNEFILKEYKKKNNLQAQIIYQEKYGQGEPSDKMFEAMCADISSLQPFCRVIGLGGGTILDLSKLFALKNYATAEDLFEKQVPLIKEKQLILIPTTCGTGSEVTNISILSFLKKKTKKGLAADELFADQAVLIPEFLEELPFRFFAASSIDAFIHAMESSLSPKATDYSRLFGYQAMDIILRGYQKIAEDGEEARIPLLKDFLTASNYAGIAFGTAGCGPVHGLSYPLSGTFHVPHGEANYAILKGVINRYAKEPGLECLEELKTHLSKILKCDRDCVFEILDQLLGCMLKKKSLKAYGANLPMLEQWVKSVLKTQQRLLQNSPFLLSEEDVMDIYKELYE